MSDHGPSSSWPAVPPPPGSRPPSTPPPTGPPPNVPPWRGGGHPQPGPWGQPAGPGRLLPLRPLGVGDVLDGAIQVFRQGFGVLAVLILLVHAPYQLVSALVLDRFLPELDDPQLFETWFQGAVEIDLLTRMFMIVGVTAIVGMLVHVLVGAAVVASIRDLDRGGRPSPLAALRESFAVSGATLGGTVLTAVFGFFLLVAVTIVLVLVGAAVPILAVLIGLATLPLLAAILLAVGYLVIPVAVQEQTGPWRSMVRAIWVLRQRFWWVLGVTSLALLLVAAVTIGVMLLFGVLSLLAGPAGFVLDGISGTISALVSVPLTLGAATLIHHDARVRAEGLDLRARAGGASWG